MGHNWRERRDRELKNNEQMNGWTGREWERKRGNCKEKEILNGEERRKWKMAERDGREWEWN